MWLVSKFSAVTTRGLPHDMPVYVYHLGVGPPCITTIWKFLDQALVKGEKHFLPVIQKDITAHPSRPSPHPSLRVITFEYW